MDASLSTDTAFSLNNLSFTMWKPDYVTFSMDYQQSEETELQNFVQLYDRLNVSFHKHKQNIKV